MFDETFARYHRRVRLITLEMDGKWKWLADELNRFFGHRTRRLDSSLSHFQTDELDLLRLTPFVCCVAALPVLLL